MDSPIYHTEGVPPADSNSDSIDVVTVTPKRTGKKVKIMTPEESVDSPKADGRKRQRRPNKSILKRTSSGDSPVIPAIQKCKEENETQSTPPMMDCLEQFHTLSEVIPPCNPELNEMEELPAFTMVNPETFEPQSTVPYGGQAGDATPFFMPGRGLLISGPNETQGLPAFSQGAFVCGASMPYIGQEGDATPFFMQSNGILIPAPTGGIKVFGSPEKLAEEASRKRELRLMKNRAAAKACRIKRKEYIKHLEYTNSLLEIKMQQLMQEIEVYKSMCVKNTTFN
ncbi:cAMP-responsive element modulator-like [Hyla sarda]|uniref:cAMP-responsive element modulator-like n=1 Tax=Hyla sarda TaxID=327740 RepID=UPI0024C37BF8|nr:cAMP-responsive element modulator-like [Hyla sarda]XP_056375472.1 cAMP-responsive element modulator-like [Hyla sarda]XP_056375473.1 cAMP-responsive element modulator-like [Hyla sarda]